MAKQQLYIVNFGTSKGGLSTVGYTVYNTDGTVKSARSTSGVVEIGTSTGIYAANISIDAGSDYIVLWDTGDANVRYSTEEYRTQLNSIQEETDLIRLIWNTLRNQADFYTRLIDKVDKLKAMVEALGATVADISKKEFPKKDIPKDKLSIPDYKDDLAEIKRLSVMLNNELNRVPKKQKEYDVNFSNLISILNTIQKKIADDNSANIDNLNSQINSVKEAFSQIGIVLSQMNDLHRKLLSLDENDKGILKTKEKIFEEIKRLNMFIYNLSNSVAFKEAKDMQTVLMAFGHHRKKNG